MTSLKHLALVFLAAAAVVVDPFPFGGGVTSLEALSVGTPVVTAPVRTRGARCVHPRLYSDFLLVATTSAAARG